MNSLIENNRIAIRQTCEENNVRSLYFFGSIVKARKFRSDSDIDILVSFKDGITLEEYTDSYFRLLFELEELLSRKIDITTERSVKNPYFRKELDKTKVLFYDSLMEVNG